MQPGETAVYMLLQMKGVLRHPSLLLYEDRGLTVIQHCIAGFIATNHCKLAQLASNHLRLAYFLDHAHIDMSNSFMKWSSRDSCQA